MNAIPKLGDGYVHFSNLKHIARSPAHYRVAAERRLSPTKQMVFGSLSHQETLLRGNVLGTQEFIVWEGKRGEKGWKAFKEQHEGQTIITREESDRSKLVAQAVLRDPVAAPWLVGEREKHILWQYQGRDCSSRLDVLGDGFVADLKTCTNADPEKLSWDFAKLGYHAQLAFYSRAAAEIGRPVRSWAIIAVEVQPPFAVTVLRLSPKTIEAGDMLVCKWMARLLSCESTDEWPGYVQSAVEWDLSDDPGIILEDEPAEDAA